MKKFAANALIICCIALGMACKKTAKEKTLNLTSCETGANCTYHYAENSELNMPGFSLKKGKNHIFWYLKSKAPMTTAVYFNVSNPGSAFSLDQTDIAAGKVLYRQSCPTCDYIAMKPVGGYVKGVYNDTERSSSYKNTWLIEARLFLAGTYLPNVKDTIYIKQYFVPNLFN